MTKVLITRPLAAAEATARQVAELSLKPLIAPLTRITSLDASLPEGVPAQTILLTSRHGAEAAVRLGCAHIPALAVGDVTTYAAWQAGFTRVRSAGGDGRALLSLAQSCLEPGAGPLWHIGGRELAIDIAAELRLTGFDAEHIAAYENAPLRVLPEEAESALKHETLAAALFYAPSAARVFCRLAAPYPLNKCVAVGLGEATTHTLAGMGWKALYNVEAPEEILPMLVAALS